LKALYVTATPGGDELDSTEMNRHMVIITLCHFDAALAAEKSRQFRMDEISRGVYPALDAGLEMTSQPMDY
jgi:hypothetical protein